MKKKINLTESDNDFLYSNTAKVTSSHEEAFLEFGVSRPVKDELYVNVHSKIAMSYPSMKRLVLSLGEHLRKYEKLNGEIKIQADEK